MSTPACIANAIADALGAQDIILPATPRRIHELMQDFLSLAGRGLG
jgi:2-furoyl-CoA dehydrogenase large subunit